jgi:hypothetical protein
MIYRDIVERYNISNIEILKFFIKKIFASVTVPLSINKTYNDIKSMGYKISNKYLYEYLEYCNSIFLTQNVHKFYYSEIKQAKSDKKCYVTDNGLLSAIDYRISGNKGKLLENAVAMELLKQGEKILYYKDNYECDFILQRQNEYIPLQVSWDVGDDATVKREIRGLLSACKATNSKSGTILTFNSEKSIKNDDFEIKVVPFYKYFR